MDYQPTELEFVDAPPSRSAGRTSKYDKTVRQLCDHPGQWAMIRAFDSPGGASGLVGQIKKGKGVWADLKIEALSRYDHADGQSKVWARVIG